MNRAGQAYSIFANEYLEASFSLFLRPANESLCKHRFACRAFAIKKEVARLPLLRRRYLRPIYNRTKFLWGVAKTIYNVLGGFYITQYSTLTIISVHKHHKTLYILLCILHKDIYSDIVLLHSYNAKVAANKQPRPYIILLFLSFLRIMLQIQPV